MGAQEQAVTFASCSSVVDNMQFMGYGGYGRPTLFAGGHGGYGRPTLLTSCCYQDPRSKAVPEYTNDMALVTYAPQYPVVRQVSQPNRLVEEFAQLPQDVKVKVLRFAGQNASAFSGFQGEGKTRLFARLPDHVQSAAMDRALAEPVLLRRQGSASSISSMGLSASKYEGKTAEFASLPAADKLRVLDCAGINIANFRGVQGEGKTMVFANLPEETKEWALRQASVGAAAGLFAGRTHKYEGKTAEFARLTPALKLRVLHYAGFDVSMLTGQQHEGKTALFASLSDEVKQHALKQLQVQAWSDEGDAMAQFAGLSNNEKVYVLQLCGDFTPWAGTNGEGKNGAFMQYPRHVQVRALVDAGLR